MNDKTTGLRILKSPVLWGGLVTCGFYAVLPLAPGFEASLKMLFCGHPLAYMTTAMFWVGMATLARKMLTLPHEQRSLDLQLKLRSPMASSSDTARSLNNELKGLPVDQQQTWAVRRIQGLVDYVLGRKSADGLDSHLTYLAEFSGEQLHQSYGLTRTIVWAVPILGFLGTVVGITQAIQNLDPARLETSFGMVSMGLGVAFGTTALSLGLSLVLVFGLFLVEKKERALLADVEMLALQVMTDLFPASVAPQSPLMAAEQEAGQRLIEQTDVLLRNQADAWQSAMDGLRQRWHESLTEQQQRLEQSLAAATTRAVTAQTDSMQRQAELLETVSTVLSRMQQGQQQLVQTQEALAARLAAIENNNSLDETLHTLNAAIHLLTARTGSRAA